MILILSGFGKAIPHLGEKHFNMVGDRWLCGWGNYRYRSVGVARANNGKKEFLPEDFNLHPASNSVRRATRHLHVRTGHAMRHNFDL